jgi:hypothetical protein
MLHEEAADHRSEHNNNAYDGEHDASPGANAIWFPPAW